MSTQHTPGPWHVCRQDASMIRDSKGAPLAFAGSKDLEQDDINARLIAAAPELLAALTELLAECDEFHNPNTEGWNMARAALAKVLS